MVFLTQDLTEDIHFHSGESWRNLQNSCQYDPARHRNKEPIIPSPFLFEFSELEVDAGDGIRVAIPTVAECAVHLELLEAFKVLREQVIKSNQLDVLFGTLPRKQYQTVRKYVRGKAVTRRVLKTPIKALNYAHKTKRKDKWPAFVDRAFYRFQVWANHVWARRIERRVTSMTWEEVLDGDLVPPLGTLPRMVSTPFVENLIDILLIWHAFLLEPRLLRQWSEVQRLPWIRRAVFPWERIHAFIGASDRKFALPRENARVFTAITSLQPDLLMSLVDGYGDTPANDGRFLGLNSPRNYGPNFNNAISYHDAWVDRMCNYLWIRSPAVVFTLTSARERYRKLLELLAASQVADLAPCSDTELVWLTHQCSPTKYAEFVQKSVGRKVEHSIVPMDQENYNKSSSLEQLFEAKSGRNYKFCLCWDCQAIQQLVRKPKSATSFGETQVQDAMEEVKYFRVVELARRRGGMLPVRNW